MFKKATLGILFIATFNVFNFANPVYASEIQNPNAIFEIYKTENLYNVLKLNTRNGCITQVQIGVGNNSERMEVNVNNVPLVGIENQQSGRFALYPTGNMYNFILMDRISGKTWQVQWHTSPDKRFIMPIS